jgi:3-dehydroquinate synthase
MSDQIPKIAANLKASKAFVLCDSKVQRVGRIIAKKIHTVCKVDLYVMEADEQSKDLRHIFPIISRMIEHGMDREAVLFAVGGGVVGDVGGFIAAIYMRGIRWVGIPTTLLAQIDSSVGGKTGVNHRLGKNLMGAFHQPVAVICDIAMLETLSERDRVSGFGEMIKYGLACNDGYYEMLSDNWSRVLSLDTAILPKLIVSAIRCKADIVSRDEKETRGMREILNFGHTIGHALEVVTRYRSYRHGEALILGMRLAASISVERKHLDLKTQERVDGFLKQIPVPEPPVLSLERLMKLIGRDKKQRNGRTAFVLLKRIGQVTQDNEVSRKDISSAFKKLDLGLRS